MRKVAIVTTIAIVVAWLAPITAVAATPFDGVWSGAINATIIAFPGSYGESRLVNPALSFTVTNGVVTEVFPGVLCGPSSCGAVDGNGTITFPTAAPGDCAVVGVLRTNGSASGTLRCSGRLAAIAGPGTWTATRAGPPSVATVVTSQPTVRVTTAPPTVHTDTPLPVTAPPTSAPVAFVPTADPRADADHSIADSAFGSDAVSIGSGELKLGWTLFGRTDLPDDVVAAAWQKSLRDRLGSLTASQNDAASRLDTLMRQQAALIAAADAQRLPQLRAAIDEDLKDSRKEQADAGWDVLKAIPGAVLPAGVGASAKFLPAATELLRKADKGYELFESADAAVHFGAALTAALTDNDPSRAKDNQRKVFETGGEYMSGVLKRKAGDQLSDATSASLGALDLGAKAAIYYANTLRTGALEQAARSTATVDERSATLQREIDVARWRRTELERQANSIRNDIDILDRRK